MQRVSSGLNLSHLILSCHVDYALSALHPKKRCCSAAVPLLLDSPRPWLHQSIQPGVENAKFHIRVQWCISIVKMLKDIKSHWFWFFDSLAPKIFLQFHNLNSPGTTTAPASLSGTCHHWRWRWHWKNLRPVYFHCMTCMIACNSSITAVKTACIIEARIKELILFSRCKLQKCYITLQFSPCTLVRPQKLQRPSAALSSPCASKLTIADPQIQIKLSRIWQRIDKGKLKKTAKTWRRSSAMAWQRSNSVAGSETRSRCSRAYQLWNQNLKMSDQNVAKCM